MATHLTARYEYLNHNGQFCNKIEHVTNLEYSAFSWLADVCLKYYTKRNIFYLVTYQKQIICHKM